MADKYVQDMNPQELRAHMRRLQAQREWHEPLADSMYAEIQRLDIAIRDAYAAGMARAAEIAQVAAEHWEKESPPGAMPTYRQARAARHIESAIRAEITKGTENA